MHSEEPRRNSLGVQMRNLPSWYKLWLAVSSIALLLMLAAGAHYAYRRGLPLINIEVARNGDTWDPDAYGGVLQMLIPWGLLIGLLLPMLALPVALFVWRKRK